MPELLKNLGGLRLALVTFTLVCLPMVLLADMKPHGIGVMTAYVVPSVVVILFFVLMLDALMNRIFMIEQSDEEKAIRRRRMWLALAAAAGILLAWGPYFRALVEG